MEAHSIRHAWFPPDIPKRKLDREFDSESEWPSTYRPLSGSVLEPRPTKRLRHLEGEMAGLALDPQKPIIINTDPTFLAQSSPAPMNQIHDAPLDGEVEPYMSSIYEYASPHTGFGSSTTSLAPRGQVSEGNTSDEECKTKSDMEGRQTKGARMESGVSVKGEKEIMGHIVYEPDWSPGKRKGEARDDEHRLKKGKISRYEPEKDRLVTLALDSSSDESVSCLPRRSLSASSLTSVVQGSSIRPRAQTEIQTDASDFVINSSFLSQIPSPGTGVPPILREGNSAQAVVLYEPVPQAIVRPQAVEPEVKDIEDVAASGRPTSIQSSPLIQDDGDAMDIDT